MESQIPPKSAHLEPSPLGTKEYWDALYETEISNHAADPSDLGTIWFDDSAAEDKILAFLHSPALGLDVEETSFLDVGTGNGHFLFRLRERFPNEDEDYEDDGGDPNGTQRISRTRFNGRMVGTDYSQKSIEFAHRIAASKNILPGIEFLQHDVMASSPSALLTGPNSTGYDVLLDKGTFDAISLSSDALPDTDTGTGNSGKRLCEGYKERILPLVKDGGVFVVTSCNWTEEELRGWFEGARDARDARDIGKGEFVFETAIKYRSFRFGGREGQSISSVCFRKRKRGG